MEASVALIKRGVLIHMPNKVAAPLDVNYIFLSVLNEAGRISMDMKICLFLKIIHCVFCVNISPKRSNLCLINKRDAPSYVTGLFLLILS